LPAFGTILHGGPRSDSEFAFHPGISLETEFKVADFLVMVKRKHKLRATKFGNYPRRETGFWGIGQRSGFRGNRGCPNGDRKAQHEERGDGNCSAKTHDEVRLQDHGILLGRSKDARRMPKEA
jgi:hypothetical protein